MAEYHYQLEWLYRDQRPSYVCDLMAPLITWPDRNGRRGPPLVFEIEDHMVSERHILTVAWDLVELGKWDPLLKSKIWDFKRGIAKGIEAHSEDAGLALAMIVASVIFKVKIRAYNRWATPDLKFENVPINIRGIEVAGRADGGPAELARVREEKAENLRIRADVVEGYLSLWCRDPSLSLLEKVV